MPVVPIAKAAVVGVVLGMLGGGGSIRHIPAGHRDVAGVQAIWALSMAPTHRRADLTYISRNTPTKGVTARTSSPSSRRCLAHWTVPVSRSL